MCSCVVVGEESSTSSSLDDGHHRRLVVSRGAGVGKRRRLVALPVVVGEEDLSDSGRKATTGDRSREASRKQHRVVLVVVVLIVAIWVARLEEMSRTQQSECYERRKSQIRFAMNAIATAFLTQSTRRTIGPRGEVGAAGRRKKAPACSDTARKVSDTVRKTKGRKILKFRA